MGCTRRCIENSCTGCQFAGEKRSSDSNDLLWCDAIPTSKGFYWCYQHKTPRMVKVWGRDDKLFTNEDGGAGVNDKMYQGAKWYGPITPPQTP